MWVLYGRQRGLTSLRLQQALLGMYLDSCYNGCSMSGSARWEEMKASKYIKVLRELDEVEHVRFGGGAASSLGIYEIKVCVGSVCATLRHVVVRGQLPWLVGESGLALFSLVLDFCARAVIQRGTILSQWQPGNMPMVEAGRESAGEAKDEQMKEELFDQLQPTNQCKEMQDGEMRECVREAVRDALLGLAPMYNDNNYKDKDENECDTGGEWLAAADETADGPSPRDECDDFREMSVEDEIAEINRRWQEKTAEVGLVPNNAEEYVMSPGAEEVDAFDELYAEDADWLQPSRRRTARQLVVADDDHRPSVRKLVGQYSALMDADKEELEVVPSGVVAARPAVRKAARKVQLKGKVLWQRKKPLLSKERIAKLHRTNHPSKTRLTKFIEVAVPDYREHTAEYKSLVEAVTKDCNTCRMFGGVLESAGAVVTNTELVPNAQIWCDLFTLDWANNIEAMAIRDECTGEVALELVDDHQQAGISKPEAIYRAFHARWLTVRGVPKRFISDPDLTLEDEKFTGELQALGVDVITTAGASSESHGRVERLIRDARHDLDRMKLGAVLGECVHYLQLSHDEVWDRADWQLAVHSVENSLNNELGARGGSAAIRTRGQSTSLHQRLCDESGSSATTNSEQMRKLAIEAYTRARCSRALSTILKQAPKRDTEDLLGPGTACEVYRAAKAGKRSVELRDARWHGPGAVVRWVNTDPTSWAGYYLVNLRKHTVKVHRKHVRRLPGPTPTALVDIEHKNLYDWREEEELNVPALAYVSVRSRIATLLQTKEGVTGMSKAAGGSIPARTWSQEKTVPVSTECSGDSWVLLGERLVCLKSGAVYAGRSYGWTTKCLLAWPETDGAVRTAFASVEVSPDVYGQSWEDLPADVQRRARAKGIADYDDSESWDRSSDAIWSELGRNDEKMSGRWVDKPKQIFNAALSRYDLEGRSRWTPKGFQEWACGETSSPTATAATHRLVEALGMRERMVPFSVDFSAAFFQSDTMESIEPGRRLWIEVPEGDPAFVPGVRKARLLKKFVPGTKEAPLAWFRTVRRKLLELGWEVSKLDGNLFYRRSESGGVLAALPVHVDDGKGYVQPWFYAALEKELRSVFKVGEFENLQGRSKVFLGVKHTHAPGGSFVDYDQESYSEKELKIFDISDKRAKQRDSLLDSDEISRFRSTLGQAAWVALHTASEWSYETSALAGRVQSTEIPATVDDVLRLNRVAKAIRSEKGHVRMRQLDREVGITVRCVLDGGEGERDTDDWERAHSGYAVALTSSSDDFVPIIVRSTKAKRVTHSSFDVETVTAVSAVDATLWVKFMVLEWYAGVALSRGDRILRAVTDGDGRTESAGHQRQHRSQKSFVPGCSSNVHQPNAPSSALARSSSATKHTEAQAPAVTAEMYSDCFSLVQAVCTVGSMPKGTQKRRVFDVADLKECLALGDLSAFYHIDGKTNPLDCLTKKSNRCVPTRAILQSILRTGLWRPQLSDAQKLVSSGRKKKKR